MWLGPLEEQPDSRIVRSSGAVCRGESGAMETGKLRAERTERKLWPASFHQDATNARRAAMQPSYPTDSLITAGAELLRASEVGSDRAEGWITSLSNARDP